MTQFDVLIKGGEVIDPAAGYSGRLDVGIVRDRIAAVGENIPSEAGGRVIDASGQLVTPGLVDLHTHIYHGVTFWGVRPDPVAARSGVTTWLDVGSAGGYTLPGFREFIVKPSRARIYALLNISSIGLTAQTWELANLNYCDADLCCTLIDLNRDLVLGVKARVDRHTLGTNGLEPLRRARMAADRCGLPLMVHIGEAPPLLGDLLPYLRPSDILTHCYTGAGPHVVDGTGDLLAVARQAWDAGIIMDIGHGAGSFSFATAERLLAAGLRPDVISSDLHQVSIHGPLFDLPTCLSKFLALGLSLPEVIRAATSRPAEVMKLGGEIGTLRPGALADVALFRLLEGRFTFYDTHLHAREGKHLLHNTLTLINGEPLPLAVDDPPAPWIRLSDGQQALIERGHTPAAYAAGITSTEGA